MILRAIREIIKLDDYELIFTELKRLDHFGYMLELNKAYGTEGLNYENLRLYGYRKLTLPVCKKAMRKALISLVEKTCKAYK